MRTKFLVTALFAIATGLAFTTHSSPTKPFADSQQQLTAGCTNVTTGCNNSGNFACGYTNTVYKIPGAGESNCSITLLKRDSPL